jgi:hypothetical protein
MQFYFYKISIFSKSEPKPSPFGHYIEGDGFFDRAVLQGGWAAHLVSPEKLLRAATSGF